MSSDTVRVFMTLTSVDVANAKTIQRRFGLDSKAQAVSTAVSIALSLLELL